MAKINSGSFQYERVRKDDDYGINRKSGCLLAFTVDEGENVDAVLAEVSEIAIARVHNALKIGSSAAGVNPGTGASPVPQPTPAAEAKPSPPKRGKPPQQAQQPETPLPAAQPVVPVTPPPLNDDLSDLLGGAPVSAAVEITDKELMSEITHINGILKDTDKIRRVAWRYNGGPPAMLTAIPQAERAKFIAELKALLPAS